MGSAEEIPEERETGIDKGRSQKNETSCVAHRRNASAPEVQPLSQKRNTPHSEIRVRGMSVGPAGIEPTTSTV